MHVKGWSKCSFGNTQHELAQNETKLKILEDKLLIQPDSPRLDEWLNRLLCQREKSLMFNQKYWGGLKRKDWLVNGDRNSKFFSSKGNCQKEKKDDHKAKR